MKKPWKIFCIFLKITSLLILLACSEENEFTPNYLKMDKNLPFTEADSMWINVKKLDKLQSRIFAKKSYTYAKNSQSEADSIIAINVTLYGYDENGVQNAVMLADSAFINNKQNLIYAFGDIDVDSVEGKLKCQKLFWNRNPLKEKLEAEEKVYLDSERGKLWTDLLIWDRPKDEIFCPNNVKLHRNQHISYGKNLKTNRNMSYVHMDSVKAKGTVNEKNFSF